MHMCNEEGFIVSVMVLVCVCVKLIGRMDRMGIECEVKDGVFNVWKGRSS